MYDFIFMQQCNKKNYVNFFRTSHSPFHELVMISRHINNFFWFFNLDKPNTLKTLDFMIHRGMQLLDICTLVKQSNHSNAFLIEIFGHPGWSYLYTKPNYILVSFYLTYLQSNKRLIHVTLSLFIIVRCCLLSPLRGLLRAIRSRRFFEVACSIIVGFFYSKLAWSVWYSKVSGEQEACYS